MTKSEVVQATKGKRKQAAKLHAKIRIQRKQKARAGSSGLIDTVKARKSPDSLRYERERKAVGHLSRQEDGSYKATGELADIVATQEAAQLSSYMVGFRLELSEAEGKAYARTKQSEKAQSEGFQTKLREHTTLSVQMIAARTGRTYKSIWRDRNKYALALILRREIENPTKETDREEIKAALPRLPVYKQVHLYCSVFDILAKR